MAATQTLKTFTVGLVKKVSIFGQGPIILAEAAAGGVPEMGEGVAQGTQVLEDVAGSRNRLHLMGNRACI